MSARADILARSGARTVIDALRPEAAALLVDLERPALADGPLDTAFLAVLTRPGLGATHDAIPTLAELPAAIMRYLANHAATVPLYLPPDPRLDSCDWSGVVRVDACAVDSGAALAFARCGVAETGSLVLETAPEAPMLPNFLCLHHIVVLDRVAIVPWLEDALLLPGPQPRAHYWLTGVSGTTDIEGTYVRGAHGPRFLHVVLLG